jgi:hypothetical protein
VNLSLEITGLDALLDAFARAPDSTARSLRVAVKEGAVMIQREARRTHRFQTRSGRLERSVEVVSLGESGASASATVFLNESVARYAEPIHEGSRPHVIRPRNRTVLRFPSGAGFSFAPSVNHPGTKPDQFLYTSAELMQPAVEMRIQQGVNDAIEAAGLA